MPKYECIHVVDKNLLHNWVIGHYTSKDRNWKSFETKWSSDKYSRTEYLDNMKNITEILLEKLAFYNIIGHTSAIYEPMET